MQAIYSTAFCSSSSAQPTLTHPKEGIMKTRLYSLIRRSAVLLLAIVALTASSAAAQAVDGHSGQALLFDGGVNWVEVPHTRLWPFKRL